MVSNNEIFDEFLKNIKTYSKEQILKEYGGSAIYIPSYKTTARNEEIKNEFKILNKDHLNKYKLYKQLSYKYNLSIVRIRKILKED